MNNKNTLLKVVIRCVSSAGGPYKQIHDEGEEDDGKIIYWQSWSLLYQDLLLIIKFTVFCLEKKYINTQE